jgi:hypothetical protein
MRLPPISVGFGANSVFTTAPQPGAVDYYSSAKAQIADLISLASSYSGAANEIAPIAVSMSELANDVANFNAADRAAVTSSALWVRMLSESPTPNQVTVGGYPVAAAQSLALDATTIQSMIALMPSTTTAAVATANAVAAAETYAQIKTAKRGNISAIAPTPTSQAPVTVVVQSPAPPSAFASLPWNFIIGGALVVGAVLFVTEEKRKR